MTKVEIDGKAYCVETLIHERERLIKEIKASAELHKSVLDKIRAEIQSKYQRAKAYNSVLSMNAYTDCLQIIDKYREGENEKNKKRFENELVMMQTNIFPYKGEQK